jgi:hypothetical protein
LEREGLKPALSDPAPLVSLWQRGEYFMEKRQMSEQFKPGEKVPRSGIYKVTHDRNHVQEHEVTCVMGETFPPCNGCGPHPRFALIRAAHHVFNHEHFK